MHSPAGAPLDAHDRSMAPVFFNAYPQGHNAWMFNYDFYYA